MSTSVVDAYWAAPPIARTLTLATIVLSINFWVLPELRISLINGDYFVFYPRLIFKLWVPHLWRLVTGFLISGPKLGLLFDPYFLFTYCKALEVDSPRFSRRGDLVVALCFICSVIMLLVGMLFGPALLLSPLILAMAWLHVQDAPDAQMKFFFFNIRRKYLPLCMLGVTCILAGPIPMIIEAMGLVAAHCYDFLTRIWPSYGGGSNPLKTPQFVHRWFPAPITTRSYGTAFQAQPPGGRAQPRAPASSSWTSGFTGSWGGRGAGRRLGSD